MALKKRMFKRKGNRKSRFGSKKLSLTRSRALGNSSFGTGSQYATIQESLTLVNVVANTAVLYNTVLSRFKRAMAIAANFKWYRAVLVEYRYEPVANVFDETGTTMPYFYYVMNRTQDNQGYNQAQIEAMGAVGRRFTKPVIVKYKPNWCSAGLTVYTTSQIQPPNITSINATGLKAETDWLATPNSLGSVPVTQPSQSSTLQDAVNPGSVISTAANYTANVPYNGHTVFVHQDTAATGEGAHVCRVVINVTWQFKGPKVNKDILNDPLDGGIPV
jgi:hypothetical protein